MAALRGAPSTIAAQRPLIMVEDNSNSCVDFLQGLGYGQLVKMPGLTCCCPLDRRDDFSFLL